MLDPKEQAKGGFGAQIARAEEQHFLRASEQEAAAATPADESQGGEARAPQPPVAPALPTPPARTPKRWH